jgi:single-strand DNA-binding protein
MSHKDGTVARGVNDIHIIGNLGADPEVRHTPSDKMVCNMRVAVSRSGGRDGEEVTDWFRVVVWDKLAETCSRYLKKGSKVYFRGEMRSSQYEDKDTNKKITSWELNAFNMQMLDSRADGEDRDDDRPRGRSRDDDRDRERERRPSRDRDDDRRPAARRARDDDDDEDDEPAPPKSRGSSRYSESRR